MVGKNARRKLAATLARGRISMGEHMGRAPKRVQLDTSWLSLLGGSVTNKFSLALDVT